MSNYKACGLLCNDGTSIHDLILFDSLRNILAMVIILLHIVDCAIMIQRESTRREL